jgi:cell division protein FtsZ
MSFDFAPEIGEPTTFNACIKVIGVGGGGGNAVEHMIDKKAQGITFIAANTDQQALNRSRADIVIPLGKTGLGAGAKPEVGAAAAMDATDQIRESLEGTHLLFITAGMGGGTGTGAAPVIAKIAKELGILTVAVVTKPFEFEGSRRMRQAQAGIENLKEQVDSLIVILNDKLEEEVGDNATMVECFAAADDVLYKACNGIAEIIHTPGLINVDFEDLRTVMSERGTAMMGTATAAGPDRAREAAQRAIACPLLEGANLQGARGLLVYVTASADTMTQAEVRQVMTVMKNFVSKDAIQLIGTAFDNEMGEELRVTVVATGLDRPASDMQSQPPVNDRSPEVILSNSTSVPQPAGMPQQTVVTAPPMHAAAPQPAYEPAPQPMRPATAPSEPDVWGGSSSSSDPFSMANVPSILRNK